MLSIAKQHVHPIKYTGNVVLSPIRGKIITSGIGRIVKSLAYETYLYNRKPDNPILFIRQTVPTVVFGYNQNPWIECNMEKINKGGIVLK